DVRHALEEALPDGLDVVEVVVSGPDALADRLEASRWSVVVAMPADDVARGAEAFLAPSSVPVGGGTKKGIGPFDGRQPVEGREVRPHVAGGELDLALGHTVPAVRPDDGLSGLAEVAGLHPATPPLLTRLRQGPLDTGTGEVGDPLE